MSSTQERLLQQRKGVPIYPGGRNLVGILAPRLKVVDLGSSRPAYLSGIVIGDTIIQSLTTDECTKSTEAGPILWADSLQTEAISFPVSTFTLHLHYVTGTVHSVHTTPPNNRESCS